MFLIFIILINGPFLLLTWHIIKENHEKKRKLISLFGGIWGLISMVPYMMMVGGGIEVSFYLAILTFPAWITMEIIDFCYPLFKESHFFIWYLDSFISATFFLPFFLGMTLFYGFSLFLIKLKKKIFHKPDSN